MLAAVLSLLVLLLLGGLVLAYVAFPHRRRPIPGAPPQVGDAVVGAVASAEERLGLAGEAPAGGLLGSDDRDRRARARFERVEQRIAGGLRPSRRRGTAGPRGGRVRRGPDSHRQRARLGR